MNVGDTSFHKGLGLLRVLTLTDLMAAICKADNLVYQALCHRIQIDKQSSGISVHIERLVQVFAMVHFLDQLHNDVRDTIYLPLLTHEIDLVVQRLGDLKD